MEKMLDKKKCLLVELNNLTNTVAFLVYMRDLYSRLPQELSIRYREYVSYMATNSYRKISKEELLKEEKEIKEHSKEKEEAKEENKSVIKGEKTKGKFTEEEMAEMNRVLKEKTRNLKLKTEKEVKDKKLKEEEIEKKKEEIEEIEKFNR